MNQHTATSNTVVRLTVLLFNQDRRNVKIFT